MLAIADRAVLLVKGAVAWEGPARDARATLEAHMLGGAAANGSAPFSTNGSYPAPHGVVPSAVSPRAPTSVPPPPGAVAPGSPGPGPATHGGPPAQGGSSGGGGVEPPFGSVGGRSELPQHQLTRTEPDCWPDRLAVV